MCGVVGRDCITGYKELIVVGRTSNVLPVELCLCSMVVFGQPPPRKDERVRGPQIHSLRLVVSYGCGDCSSLSTHVFVMDFQPPSLTTKLFLRISSFPTPFQAVEGRSNKDTRTSKTDIEIRMLDLIAVCMTTGEPCDVLSPKTKSVPGSSESHLAHDDIFLYPLEGGG
jgi:hypothetical protein